MASNKYYKPGQLITVTCNDTTMLCRVTESLQKDTCIECETINGINESKEICRNIVCVKFGPRNYPKLVKQCKKV